MSSEYSVSFGVTYWVEADSPEDAEAKASELVLDDYGKAFFHDAWITDAEERGQV